MITLSYEILVALMTVPMILSYIIHSCDGESKRKEIKYLKEKIKDLREEYSNLFDSWQEELNEWYNKEDIIESQDKQIKDLEGNVAREFALRKKMEQKKQNPYEKRQNPYEGMTNMEIAKQDDRERRLKLKK